MLSVGARNATTVAMKLLLVAGGLLLAVVLFGPPLGVARTATVLSGSMQPDIPAGALVVDRPVAASSVRVGDVITFRSPSGALFTHRVIALRGTGASLVAHTKGDANSSADAWVVSLGERNAWRTTLVVPSLGRLANDVRRVTDRGALTLLLPALLAGAALKRIWLPTHKEVGDEPIALA